MATSMSAILSNVTEIVTSGVSWMGQIVTFITENPLVLMFVLLGLIGTGIGLVQRLIGR